jgi:hypothetical protein
MIKLAIHYPAQVTDEQARAIETKAKQKTTHGLLALRFEDGSNCCIPFGSEDDKDLAMLDLIIGNSIPHARQASSGYLLTLALDQMRCEEEKRRNGLAI